MYVCITFCLNTYCIIEPFAFSVRLKFYGLIVLATFMIDVGLVLIFPGLCTRVRCS